MLAQSGILPRDRDSFPRVTGEFGHVMQYAAYGLRIEADVDLEGLADFSGAQPADLRIRLASPPDWPAGTSEQAEYRKADYVAPSGEVIRRVFRLPAPNAGFHLAYRDGSEFFVSDTGAEIRGRWPPPYTLADTLTYVLGPILGIALRLQNRICLHASAVEIDGRALLFVGPAGAGKSTTAAALTLAGARLLTDDIAVVRDSGGKSWIEPGHAWLRLWRKSAHWLYGDDDALPPLTPNWDKRYLDASQTSAPQAVPLSHVFLLGGLDSTPSSGRLTAPASPHDTLLWLSSNTYAPAFVSPGLRRDEFETFSRISREIPATILRHGEEETTAPHFTRRILDHAARTEGR